MQTIDLQLRSYTSSFLKEKFGTDCPPENVVINATPPEYEGQFTIVAFSLLRYAKMKPEELAQELGAYINSHCSDIESFNVVKGFLNFVVADSYWKKYLENVRSSGQTFGKQEPKNQTVVVEFSSPNTNKPLHLGHIRNILLGWSMSRLYDYAGYNVIKTQVINDRGIHICKSMLAWERFGNGDTPESTGMKGDHLVGHYYVLFELAFQKEYKTWQESEEAQAILTEWKAGKAAEKAMKDLGKEANEENLVKFFFKEVYKNQYFNKYSEIGAAATKMLEAWEAGDEKVRTLWTKMNGWVYDGMNVTWRDLGVSFDENYYESQTYLFGKDIIEKGLSSGTFFKADDGSVRVDLRDAKLDEKILLRSNGTSVYITQDIGMAPVRYGKYKMDKMIYVVGDEQEYHFKVLFEILKRLGEPYSAGLYHLSYGMVELPEGKMKSREGTVVDADELIEEVIKEVAAESTERNTLDGLSEEDKKEIHRRVALGALKFFMLKINPKSRMIFDPKQSIDLQGQTGPYIQNAFVKTQAVQRRAEEMDVTVGNASEYNGLAGSERELIRHLHHFEAMIVKAANEYNPADVANYVYELARGYHKFWAEVSILKDEPAAIAFRLELSKAVATTLENAMSILGVEMPQKM